MKKVKVVSQSEITEVLKLILTTGNCEWKNLRLKHLPTYVGLLTPAFKDYSYQGYGKFFYDMVSLMLSMDTMPHGSLKGFPNAHIIEYGGIAQLMLCK